MEKMNNTIRIRIIAGSEAVSVEYACRILPHIAACLGVAIKAVQVTVQQYIDQIPFVDVKTWDWASSINRLRNLAENGTNLLILSESFLEWGTDAEAINNELYMFEDELSALGISVISAEAYHNNKEELSCFKKMTKWNSAHLCDIVQKMLEGFRAESLVLPYGWLPYILIDPEDPVPGQMSQNFRALVGFQPWQCEKILEQYPAAEFQIMHMLAKVRGENVPQTGAIPMNIFYD